MWWSVLACFEPDPRVTELAEGHEALQGEVIALDERVGRVTSGIGELETRVDLRVAELETQLAALRQELEQRATPKAAPLASWLGAWTVQAEPVNDLGCEDSPEAGSFRWQIAGSAERLSVGIEGNTRFRELWGALEAGSLSAAQSDGFDISMVVIEPTSAGFAGYRVLTRIERGRPCTLIWKLQGQRG